MEEYDFEEAMNNILVDKKEDELSLYQVKLTYYYWNNDDKSIGMPICTSIELKYDNNDKLIKEVKHLYYGLNDLVNPIIEEYKEEYNDENIFDKIKKYDLRKLNNNYFTDKEPERYERWEINYNDYFYIVGTFDQVISEYEEISNLLEFETIRNEIISKVNNKLDLS